jgi:serine beta-lactamase-like protein LACTB, mitochondrial
MVEMTQRGRTETRLGGSWILTAALLWALAPGSAWASPRSDDRAEALIAAAMAESHLPSLSVAVGRDGKIVLEMALGLADLEGSVPATTRSVYRIGSVSKTLTATAVLRLAEDGRLDLDAPVQKCCPTFPDKGAITTPRLLLAHLGGIRDYDYSHFEQEFLSRKRYASIDDALGIFKDDPYANPPGSRYRYSSFGYVLLGCVVEGASGTGYAAYVREHVLDPAGMARTRLDDPAELVPFRVRGYHRDEDGTWRNAPYVDLSDRYPAGGFLSTPEDLVRFGMSLLGGKLLGEETLAAAWQPQQTSGGETVPYGLGWRLSSAPREVFHGGTSVGGSAYLYLQPDTGVVVALATNVDLWTEPRHELARQLAALALAPPPGR